MNATSLYTLTATNWADAASATIAAAAAALTRPPIVMADSAALCLRDARELQAEGRHEYAMGRATSALAYIGGVFSPLHMKAQALQKALSA